MSIRNAGAVVEGLFENGGVFHRTPKSGGVARVHGKNSAAMEITLTIFFILAILYFALTGHWASLPFLTLFVGGYGYISWLSLDRSEA